MLFFLFNLVLFRCLMVHFPSLSVLFLTHYLYVANSVRSQNFVIVSVVSALTRGRLRVGGQPCPGVSSTYQALPEVGLSEDDLWQLVLSLRVG